jgi:hypothetical protein
MSGDDARADTRRADTRRADSRINASGRRLDRPDCYRHPNGAYASAMPDPIHAGFWIPIVIVGGISSELPGRTRTQGDALQVAMAHLDYACGAAVI